MYKRDSLFGLVLSSKHTLAIFNHIFRGGGYDVLLEILNYDINPLNAEFNPICHLLALVGAHPIFHVSRIRVNSYSIILYKRIFCVTLLLLWNLSYDHILNAKVFVNYSLYTSNIVSALPMVSVDFLQCSVLPTIYVH